MTTGRNAALNPWKDEPRETLTRVTGHLTQFRPQLFFLGQRLRKLANFANEESRQWTLRPFFQGHDAGWAWYSVNSNVQDFERQSAKPSH